MDWYLKAKNYFHNKINGCYADTNEYVPLAEEVKDLVRLECPELKGSKYETLSECIERK